MPSTITPLPGACSPARTTTCATPTIRCRSTTTLPNAKSGRPSYDGVQATLVLTDGTWKGFQADHDGGEDARLARDAHRARGRAGAAVTGDGYGQNTYDNAQASGG